MHPPRITAGCRVNFPHLDAIWFRISGNFTFLVISVYPRIFGYRSMIRHLNLSRNQTNFAVWNVILYFYRRFQCDPFAHNECQGRVYFVPADRLIVAFMRCLLIADRHCEFRPFKKTPHSLGRFLFGDINSREWCLAASLLQMVRSASVGSDDRVYAHGR